MAQAKLGRARLRLHLVLFYVWKKKILTVVVSQCESPIKGKKNILHVGVYITCIVQSTGTHPGLFLALTRAKFETSFTKVHRLIRYVKILTWLRGFRVKIANFSRLHCLASPRRDLSTKKTKPNKEKSPESLSTALFGNSTFQECGKVFELLFINVWGRYVDN